MANYKGNGRANLERARKEPDLRRRAALLEDALDEVLRELEYVFQHLGPENFCEDGLKRIREAE